MVLVLFWKLDTGIQPTYNNGKQHENGGLDIFPKGTFNP